MGTPMTIRWVEYFVTLNCMRSVLERVKFAAWWLPGLSMLNINTRFLSSTVRCVAASQERYTFCALKNSVVFYSTVFLWNVSTIWPSFFYLNFAYWLIRSHFFLDFWYSMATGSFFFSRKCFQHSCVFSVTLCINTKMCACSASGLLHPSAI